MQASAKQVISRCSDSSVWAVRAASSAKSVSLMRILRTFVFARRRARLKRLSSLPGGEEDAIFRLSEGVKKQQGEEDAEECLSVVGKGSEHDPSC